MGSRTLPGELCSHLGGRRGLGAKIAEKEKTLHRVRQQLAKRNQELARLWSRLTRAETTRHSSSLSRGNTQVFFLLGRARSGTTWLRSILNSHPEILCWGEGRFFERSFKREDLEQSQVRNITPSSLYGAMLDSKYLRAWIDKSVWARNMDTDTHLINLTRLAVDYFLDGQLSRTDKKIVGDKTPFVSAEVLEEISVIYPEAKVIHIIRDGRDVAVSLIHHMWNHAISEGGVYDLEQEELERRRAYREGSLVPPAGSLFTRERLIRMATDWSTEVSKAIKDGPTLLGENYTEVRYEDLLERPVEEAERLLGFLGADISEEAVEKCVETSSFESRSNRKRGQEDSSSRYRKGVVGDWKNTFTEKDKRVFKEVAGSLLLELGYEKDNNW